MMLLVTQLVLTHRAASSSLARGLAANMADHHDEMTTSAELGFERARSAVPAVACTARCMARSALGMGAHCTFDSDELVWETSSPVFTASECRAVRDEAAALIAGGAQSTFTMTDTNRDVAVHEMASTLAWLNGGAFARLTSLAASCFPSAVDDATSLWVYRGLVINYDAAAGLTHQPIHRDGALISAVVPLSARSEYEGGGTYIEALGESITLEQVCGRVSRRLPRRRPRRRSRWRPRWC